MKVFTVQEGNMYDGFSLRGVFHNELDAVIFTMSMLKIELPQKPYSEYGEYLSGQIGVYFGDYTEIKRAGHVDSCFIEERRVR